MPLSNSGNMMNSGSMSWIIFEDEFSSSLTGVPQRELEFKRTLLEAVIDQQYYYGSRFDPSQERSAKELATNLPEISLIAWVDTAPPEVRINGQVPQESVTGLYLAKILYQIPETGEVVVPPGLIPGLIAEMPSSGGTCGPEQLSLWVEQGEAVVEFILFPELLNIQIDSLQLALRTDGGWGNTPEMAIYDWETEQWQPLEKIKLGENTIINPPESISPEGLVRFRFSLSNQARGGGGCYYFGLGLQGSHQE